MEKKPESSNIKNASESDEKSSSLPRHDVPETSIVQASNMEPNMEDDIKEHIVIHFMKVESESLNTENVSDDKLSSFFTPKHDVPEAYIEKASNSEAYDSQSSQSNITEEKSESTNVEKTNKFDEKSSFPSISSHDVPETSIEQIPSNQEDFISQPSQSDITAKQLESTNIKINNESDEKLSSSSIPRHDVPEISFKQAPPNLQDYLNSLHSYFSSLEKQCESSNIDEFPELFSNDNQSSQECIQKNKSDNKSKENQDERGLSNSDSYAAIKEQPITSKSAKTFKLKFSSLQECNQKNESDTESTDLNNQYKKGEKHRLIDDNIENLESFLRSSLTKPLYNFVKEILPKLSTTGETQKDEKPKKLRCKIKRTNNSSKFYLFCLLSFIISSILILSPCIFPYLFKFYIHSGLVHMDKNDNTFATVVAELEEGILNHDATVRALSEYLEQDKPLLKVVPLIDDISVDKTYTVDIIKKRLRNKRSINDCLPSLPRFVVLENLRAEHSTIDDMKTYQEEYGNREFLILTVYKDKQIDDNLTHADINNVINIVKDTLIKANIMVKIIPFKALTEDVLEKYIL